MPLEHPNDQPKLDYESLPVASDARGWIKVRLLGEVLDIRLPLLCCQCLTPTNETWKFRSFTNICLTVPICNQCRHRWRKIRGILCTLVFMFVGAAYCLRIPDIKSTSGLISEGLFFLVVVLGLLLATLEFWGAPVRIRMPGRSAKFVYIRFRNLNFTANIPPLGPLADRPYPCPPKSLLRSRRNKKS
jgi:hypothetical protein